MPHISTKTPSGPASFHYTISTPAEPSAAEIDPSLPTVLFLHPVYIGSQIFHPQFADAKLRRFNLIGLDSRLHGKTIGEVPSHWRRSEAAEDVFSFMEALGLPPCHVVGLSMGACIALQLGVAHPDRVLSLCMISPLPLQEPADVAEGRTEIYDCWAESQRDGMQNTDAMLDAICGALQLGFNGLQTKLIKAATELAVPDALHHWTNEKLEQVHTVCIKFFCDRQPHPIELLSQISCPVTLVHCGADIAYPLECTQEILARLEEAGVDSRLKVVKDAPHFGTVTKATEINAIIHETVLKATKSTVPPPPSEVHSPFEDAYAEKGCPRMGSVDSDEDSD